jgi:hypothetical protein
MGKITVGQVRKAIVAILGAMATAVTQGLIDGAAAKWVAIAIIVATGFGVYIVPNDPAPVDGAATPTPTTPQPASTTSPPPAPTNTPTAPPTPPTAA